MAMTKTVVASKMRNQSRTTVDDGSWLVHGGVGRCCQPLLLVRSFVNFDVRLNCNRDRANGVKRNAYSYNWDSNSHLSCQIRTQIHAWSGTMRLRASPHPTYYASLILRP